MAKAPNYYTANWLNPDTFVATYRGQIIMKIEPEPWSKKLTLDCHGFHTQTTVRALNCAFQDAGLTLLAFGFGNGKTRPRVTKVTIRGESYQDEVVLGDGPTTIFLPLTLSSRL